MLGFNNKKQPMPMNNSVGTNQTNTGNQNTGNDLENYIAKRTAEIDKQAAEFSKKNPDFNMEKEIMNSDFCTYLWGHGLSVEDSYYLVHRNDDNKNTDKDQYKSRLNLDSIKNRVQENGTGRSGGSGMIKKNPKDLTDDEIDDIVRRVKEGEKISF